MGVFTFFPIIFGVVGLAMAGGGIALIVTTRSFARRADRVQGQIVGLRPRRSSSHNGGGVVYYPTVRYTTMYGQEIVRESGFGTSPPIGVPGQVVPVMYDPRRPDKFRVDTVMGRGTAAAVILIVMGVAFFAGAVFVGLMFAETTTFISDVPDIGDFPGFPDNP